MLHCVFLHNYTSDKYIRNAMYTKLKPSNYINILNKTENKYLRKNLLQESECLSLHDQVGDCKDTEVDSELRDYKPFMRTPNASP